MEFYVARRIPALNPAVRLAAANSFGSVFGIQDTQFEDDRFLDFASYEEALAAYEAETPIRVLFENGSGSPEIGAPTARFETAYEQWPPIEREQIQWFVSENASLQSSPTAEEHIDRQIRFNDHWHMVSAKRR